jgi:hypothetical protein
MFTGYGGGGAGGSIFVRANTVRGNGTIAAEGGSMSSTYHYSGGGGGGRIAIYADLTAFDPANISVAGGAQGVPAAAAGSFHHATTPPPSVIEQVTPSGYVTQALDTITVTFLLPIDAASFTADDIHITGPQSGGVAAVDLVDAATFALHFDPALALDGDYEVAIGPGIASFAGGWMDADGDGVLGEIPDDIVMHAFTIDQTPPPPPPHNQNSGAAPPPSPTSRARPPPT